MSRTGKRKKIQTKKYLLGMIILLVVGIAVVVGLEELKYIQKEG